ncbi:hypothetical protein TNCV_197781 [Trichonephila clavipes]|nr:hypothetical protein TNCV_197781 [Trichonephila clavipes]
MFQLFFNILTTRIETFVEPWDELLYHSVVELCRLDILMQQGSRYLRKLAAQLRNREAMVLHHALPHKLNKINIDEGDHPLDFIMDTLTTL